MEILTRGGLEMLGRWGHVLSGITWIGLLYYFNFVQTPSFAGFEAGPRTEAIRKLVPRALWWFRWSALATFLTGLWILATFTGEYHESYWPNAQGVSISTGMLFAITMLLNVWGVIWRNQKIVIASAEKVAAGGEADPAAAGAGRRAALASRTNTLFSIPMLFFMLFTSHWSGAYQEGDLNNTGLYWAIVFVLWAFFEANALGLLGGYDQKPIRKYLDDHKTTIAVGFGLWFVLLLLWELVLKSS